jgi:hypothetical protein
MPFSAAFIPRSRYRGVVIAQGSPGAVRLIVGTLVNPAMIEGAREADPVLLDEPLDLRPCPGWSVLTPRTWSPSPAYRSAIAWRSGIFCRQGTHQVAQTLSRMTSPRRSASATVSPARAAAA